MSKVFLVEVTVVVPVVADHEDDAIDLLAANTFGMATEAFQAVLDDMNEGDTGDLMFDAREVTEEDLEGRDEEWGEVVPFGDESSATIAERVFGLDKDPDEEDDEEKEGLWREPDHADD
jgi:hypothetical protein